MELRELPAVLGAIVVVLLDYWISARFIIDTIVWKAFVGALVGQLLYIVIQKTAAFISGHFSLRKRHR